MSIKRALEYAQVAWYCKKPKDEKELTERVQKIRNVLSKDEVEKLYLTAKNSPSRGYREIAELLKEL